METVFQESSMRRAIYVASLVLAGIVSTTTTGCLSLGTKTTHVHDNPHTEQRISALEARIGALERVLGAHASGAEVIPTE